MNRRYGAFVLVAWAWVAWLCMSVATAQDPATSERDPSGVEITWQCTPAMFPESWRDPSVAARADAIAPAVLDRTRAIVRSGLHKYPGPVLAANLKRVYLVQRLYFRGISAAGTNSRENVWLSNAGTPGYTDRFVEGVLHAELSSILLRNHPEAFDEATWRSVSPPGSSHGGGGATAVREGKAGQEPSEALYRAGYLFEYAMASVEEDFNSYALHLFCGPSSFWTAADRHPRVARKMRLAVAFYHNLDPTFTEEFFRAFAPMP